MPHSPIIFDLFPHYGRFPPLPFLPLLALQERLRGALDAENYELAAILRDELRMMED